MVHQVIRFSAQNYIKWESEFEENEENLKDLGLVDRYVFCSEDKEDEVIVDMQWKDMSSALTFLSGSKLKWNSDEGMQDEEIDTYISNTHLFSLNRQGIEYLEAGSLKFARGEGLKFAEGAGFKHMQGQGFKSMGSEKFKFASQGLKSAEGFKYCSEGFKALRGEGLKWAHGELKFNKGPELKYAEGFKYMSPGLKSMPAIDGLKYNQELKMAEGKGFKFMTDKQGFKYAEGYKFAQGFKWNRGQELKFAAQSIAYFT